MHYFSKSLSKYSVRPIFFIADTTFSPHKKWVYNGTNPFTPALFQIFISQMTGLDERLIKTLYATMIDVMLFPTLAWTCFVGHNYETIGRKDGAVADNWTCIKSISVSSTNTVSGSNTIWLRPRKISKKYTYLSWSPYREYLGLIITGNSVWYSPNSII